MTAKQDQRANGIALDDADDTGLIRNGTTHSGAQPGGARPHVVHVRVVGLTPAGSTNPTTVVSSGAPLAGPPAPFAMHVSAAPESNVFVCRVHAGMSGRLNALPADATVPSANQVASQVANQDRVPPRPEGRMGCRPKAAHDALVRNRDGSDTWYVTAGTSSADGYVALLEFLPKSIDVQSGDKVYFKPRSPNEPHTVTFPG